MNTLSIGASVLKKIIFSIVITIVLFGSLLPGRAHAFDLLDPFGFFDDNEYADNFLGIPLPPLPGMSGDFGGDEIVNNYTNSNNTNSNINSNVNSNVNSPNSTVTGNTNTNGTDNTTNQNTGGSLPNFRDRPIYISCRADDSYIEEGDSVTWRAEVTGGSGSYGYSWSGTDGLSGSASSVTKKYNNSGTKSASVQVRSNGNYFTEKCDNTVTVEDEHDYNDDDDYDNDHDYDDDYEDYDDLRVTCYPHDSRVDEGDTVRWYAEARGGDGDYDYEWDGTDNLRGSNRTVMKRYDDYGTKRASVTVRSDDGQRETKSCSTVIVERYDRDDDDDYYDDDEDDKKTVNTGAIACYANASSIQAGQPVYWISNVPSNYHVSWSGTDGLYGSGSSFRTTYLKPGAKTALVTVTAPNGQIATRACSNSVTVIGTYVAPKTYTPPKTSSKAPTKSSSIAISCMASVDFSEKGDTVVWTANVSGATSPKYFWSGSEGLSGQAPVAVKAYRADGVKTATLTVTSGTQTASQACDNAVVVGDGEGDNAAASIFSLAQIPWGIISFLVILILIITVVYLMFNKNKI